MPQVRLDDMIPQCPVTTATPGGAKRAGPARLARRRDLLHAADQGPRTVRPAVRAGRLRHRRRGEHRRPEGPQHRRPRPRHRPALFPVLRRGHGLPAAGRLAGPAVQVGPGRGGRALRPEAAGLARRTHLQRLPGRPGPGRRRHRPPADRRITPLRRAPLRFYGARSISRTRSAASDPAAGTITGRKSA